MNIVNENGQFQEEEGEEKEEDENSLWLPFEQYKDTNDINVSQWTHDYVCELLSHSFPWHEQDSQEAAHNYNCNDKPPMCKSIVKKLSHFDDFFRDQQSKGYWDKLLQSSMKKKKVVNKQKFIWYQSYVDGLPLKRLHNNMQEVLNDSKKESIINNDKICVVGHMENGYVKCTGTVLTSDESESEDSGDEVDESDPMYSRFAVIRNSFHTSEDGVVFYCQKELNRYKAKMAEMESLLESELKEIKNQHDKLRAKRAEERKLLSEGLDSSNDHDSHEEEPTEKDALNSANHRQSSSSKQERKSAIFSSIHDVFSYARTGIQGMFVKTSPNTPRKVRTNDSDSEGSDDEDTTIIKNSSCTSSTQQSTAPLLDNHDEFTRQMTSDGGLKYESSDKSVQQLSYKNLPPPLSLNSLQDKSSKS